MDRYQLADSIRLGKEEMGFASEQIDEPDSILENTKYLNLDSTWISIFNPDGIL